MLKRVVFIFCIVPLYTACTSAGLFTTIGTHLGNPLTLAVNSTTNRLYVVNSNNKSLYTNGSVQVYNITTPTAPTLVGTAATDSFSSQIYLDTVNQFLYTPNRINETITSTSGQLLQVNINEASAGFMTVATATAGGGSFGMACCGPSGQALVASSAGVLDSFTPGTGTPTLTATNLSTTASDGTVYTNPAVSQVAIIGAQAFVTIPGGNILVVNLNELGGSASPVDYVLTGVANPRGIATDGSYLYVANVDASSVPSLLVLDPYSIQSAKTDATAVATPISTTGVTVNTLTVGTGTSSTDPQQVVVGTNNIFVSNMGDDSVTVIQCTTSAQVIGNCVSTSGTTPSNVFVVKQSISVGDQPFGMARLTPAGTDTHLYVANIQDNTVSVIDVGSLSVTGTLTSP